MEAATKKGLAAGSMLIVLGLGLYGMQYLGAGTRPLVLTLIGVLCLGAYFASRSYFLLVLGGILSGLGIGLFGEPRWFVLHDFTEIGLALGFLSIFVIRLLYERHSHWWPLIPSLAFFLLGFHAWREFRLFVFSSRGWPILLVILGGLVLLGTLAGRKGRKNIENAG